nr:hypothetical protein F35D11.6 - Caenorhabditis elegans [Caenorhabditis elegans]
MMFIYFLLPNQRVHSTFGLIELKKKIEKKMILQEKKEQKEEDIIFPYRWCLVAVRCTCSNWQSNGCRCRYFRFVLRAFHKVLKVLNEREREIERYDKMIRVGRRCELLEKSESRNGAIKRQNFAIFSPKTTVPGVSTRQFFLLNTTNGCAPLNRLLLTLEFFLQKNKVFASK